MYRFRSLSPRVAPTLSKLSLRRWLLALVLVAAISTAPPLSGQERAANLPSNAQAVALDKKIMAEAKTGSEIMKNLEYLSDVVGPRLTGSANLKRANEWTAEKMRRYGLSNVHLEPWE